MIPNTISKRVLTMGVDYHNPKGGIAGSLVCILSNIRNI